ncbi:MAG: GGDEF domain-containing protein [Firmicutes bacterium]|nr:GGDEF domain-containing protein [Bacillota bacterium]
MDKSIFSLSEKITYNLLMQKNTNLLASDEDVYIFLGQDFSVNLVDFIHEELKAEFLAFVSSCTRTPSTLITKIRRYDGVYIDMSVSMRIITLKSNEYIDVRLYDISKMAYWHKEFAENNAIHSCYEKLIDGINFIYDTENKEIQINKGGNTVFEGAFDKWQNNVINGGIIEKDCIEGFHQICCAIANAAGSGYYVTETSFFNDNNEYQTTSISFNTVSYDQRPAYTVGIISNTIFPDRSVYDPLTGLYNKREIRRITDIVMKETLEKGTETVFAIVDLDHFKDMNDTFGHLSGDNAVLNASRILKDIIGERGYVGRIGGDEFFVLLPDYPRDHEMLRRLLRSIRTQIRWHFANCSEDINVTCSIGAAIYPKDADNYDDVFKLTDHCLYLAKAKGRNRFVIFNPKKHGSAESVLQSESVIRTVETVSENDKTRHIMSVIDRCNFANEANRRELIAKILKEIYNYYGIDAVQIISADKKEYYEQSNYTIEKPFAFIDMYDTYKEKLTQRGYIALGNYKNAHSFLPEIAKYMSELELTSFLIIAYCDENDDMRSVLVMTNKSQHSWSEFDINSLLVLYGIIGRLI